MAIRRKLKFILLSICATCVLIVAYMQRDYCYWGVRRNCVPSLFGVSTAAAPDPPLEDEFNSWLNTNDTDPRYTDFQVSYQCDYDCYDLHVHCKSTVT